MNNLKKNNDKKKMLCLKAVKLITVLMTALAVSFSGSGFPGSQCPVRAQSTETTEGKVSGKSQEDKEFKEQGESSDSKEDKSGESSDQGDSDKQSESGESGDSGTDSGNDSGQKSEEKKESTSSLKESDDNSSKKESGSEKTDSTKTGKENSKDTESEKSDGNTKEDSDQESDQENIPDYSGVARTGMTSMQEELDKALKEKISNKKKSIKKKEAQIQDTRTRIERLRTLLIECSSAARTADQKAVIIGTKRDHAGRPKANVRSGIDNKLDAMARDIRDRDLMIWTQKYTVEKGFDPIRPAELPEDLLSNAGPLIYQCIDDQKGSIEHVEKQIEKYQKQIEKLREERKEVRKPRVFDPNDVTIPSNFTVEEIESLIGDTNMGYLSKTFVECEKEYGVNAIFLIAIAAHESAWGSSRRARQDHNYTGYGVPSSSSRGINADRGEDNIRTTAEALANNYLSPGGRFYKGVSVSDVNKTYCATGGWTGAVVSIADNLMARILN